VSRDPCDCAQCQDDREPEIDATAVVHLLTIALEQQVATRQRYEDEVAELKRQWELEALHAANLRATRDRYEAALRCISDADISIWSKFGLRAIAWEALADDGR
jgi:hypothetical protein